MQGLDDKRLSYLPGLDGLRALAVMAVLLFHAGQRWIPGGFLGVEVFFVISGFLITCVLLESRERTGSVGLKQFWFRRARRLLPALFALLLGTLAVSVLFYPDEVAKLRGDTLAAFGYMTNWYFILDHQSYFDEVGRPSLLRHLWSLAIEEQFYLVWPVVLALLVGRLRTGGMVLLLIAAAAASSVLMAVLWNPEAGPTRVYFGTDTRAAGLLIGAALAFVWAPWKLRESRARAYSVALNFAGLTALAGLVYLHVELDQYRPFLYHGGFALVAVCSAVVIAVAVHPSAHLGRLLGLQPLRWLGTRSYAVYLWHWPVFMLTRPGLDVSIDGWELLGLRLGITLLLAEISYRLVERPVRAGALGRAWRTFRDGRGLRRWAGGARWAAPLSAAATGAVVLAAFAIAAEPPAPPEYLSVESVRIMSPASAQGQSHVRAVNTAALVGTTSDPGAVVSVPSGTTPGRPGDGPAQIYGIAPDVAVTVLGDSVMVGAAPTLAAAIPSADIDAAIGRQAQTALDILQQRRSAQALGDAVIIHIGNNGTFTTNQFDAMMQALADRRVVIFVNVKVPRSWEEPNNQVIADGVHRYSNAVVLEQLGPVGARAVPRRRHSSPRRGCSALCEPHYEGTCRTPATAPASSASGECSAACPSARCYSCGHSDVRTGSRSAASSTNRNADAHANSRSNIAAHLGASPAASAPSASADSGTNPSTSPAAATLTSAANSRTYSPADTGADAAANSGTNSTAHARADAGCLGSQPGRIEAPRPSSALNYGSLTLDCRNQRS